VASFLTTCPGLYFRAHYFIAMLPAVALLAGVGVASLWRAAAGRLPAPAAAAVAAGLLVVALLAYAVPERDYLFSMSPQELSRARYGRNPFVEAPGIGRYLDQHTRPGDRIAVLGSEPEIFFYARRRSATGYIYMYPLTEHHALASRMRDEMIREVEAARPRYVVFVANRSSWVSGPGADRTVLDWADRFLRQDYDVTGVAERLSDGSTAMRWDAQAAGYQPGSENVVYTLVRRSGAPR
jgi:hypothetical protein